MIKPQTIPINDYDYPLTDDRIAKYPLPERDHSKLLLYREGTIETDDFANVPKLLSNNDQLYFNTTRVVQARIEFRKETGARIEIFCLQPYDPKDYQMAFSSYGPVDYICLVGNARKWKEGSVTTTAEGVILKAELVEKFEDKFRIRFSWDNPEMTFAGILEAAGSTPIPPYLRRKAEKNDSSTYQTIYARQEGSVAAPTAGLHFTRGIMDKLKDKDIGIHELILHVGAGTFIPVKEENAMDHSMHAEHVTVNRSLLESLLLKKRTIAVGTTSLRTLESLYWLGVRATCEKSFSFGSLFLDQWDPYSLDDRVTVDKAISALLKKMENNGLSSFSFLTRIMVTPGYQFKVADGLFTNFHQPKSTLLLLIAAITGKDWKKIYTYALENNFRFLSYGDTSLILP